MKVRRRSLFLLTLVSAWSPACSSRDIEGAAFVGAEGGALEVREGELAGTRLEVEPGALQVGRRLFVERVVAEFVDGFVAVGPAARVGPEGTELSGRLTVGFDAGHPEIVGNDPAEDLVVLRVDAEGWLQVLPPSSFEVAAGRVTAAIDGLGTFWAAVRPSDAPFVLADYLPQAGDYYAFGGYPPLEPHTSFGVHSAPAHGVPAGGPWNVWELDNPCPLGMLCPLFIRTRGLYVGPGNDGALRIGGSYQATSSLWTAVDPLVVPPSVFEGEVVTVVTELVSSSTTRPGALHATFGERRAVEVPAGMFGDVVRLTLELDLEGVIVFLAQFDLARGVGPIAIREASSSSFIELTTACVGGRIID